ncbi:MAG: 1,4-dihydroxy-6-naphthoate synthase [Bacteroidia bacterium]|nr:1,4-dihydroxy-6-naphthoate synthase [Bacteroidia bacterium]
MTLLKLALSPCPNDTYIFYALIHNKIPACRVRFDVIFKDVEELNRLAFENPPDICKLSFHALVNLAHTYDACSTGGAMGFGNGPLLVSKTKNISVQNLNEVVLPGEHTTAHFLFRALYPDYKNNKIFLRYDKIAPYLSEHPNAAGVLIHESRFTYKEKGLFLINDLGKSWEDQTKSPIPLGGIGIKKTLGDNIKKEMPGWILQSIVYAENHPEEVMPFMKQHAVEMDDEIIWKHVRMFVNDFSKGMGVPGKKAIQVMTDKLQVQQSLQILEVIE